MRKVALSQLRPDMRLAKPLYYKGSLLLRENTRDLGRFIESLCKLGVYHLLVDDELSDGIELQESVSETTRTKCQKTLGDLFDNLKKDGMVQVESLYNDISNMIAEVMENMDVQLYLDSIYAVDDGTLAHSVNTTIYALSLGMRLGYSEEKLKQLAVGTMLHDLGKTMINRNILLKPGKLTQEEFAHIQQHPSLGYEVLKNSSAISETSRRIVLCHHERLEGSGYPNKLKGDEIDEFARIVAIADEYEALTADRCYRPALKASLAADIITKDAVDKLDMSLVAEFTKIIAIYPNGTEVKISDGRNAIVIRQTQSLPHRPVIRIVSHNDGKPVLGEEIDLSEQLNIVIRDDKKEITII